MNAILEVRMPDGRIVCVRRDQDISTIPQDVFTAMLEQHFTRRAA